MSKSLQEKELEQLILQFFNTNRAVNFATIANKIGLRRSAKSEKEIPVKFMYELIKIIGSLGFELKGFSIGHVKNTTKVFAYTNVETFRNTNDLVFYDFNNLQDLIQWYETN